MREQHIRDIGAQLDMPLPNFDEQYLALPYSNLGRWTTEGSHFEQIYEAFPIMRLAGVKTLSFLSYTGPNNREILSAEFPQTRLDHSLMVGVVGGEIARKNSFVLPPGSDTKLEIAGILHDIATPALGDPTKLIDPPALHEEDNWQDLLDENGKKFLAKHGTNPAEISTMIKNQGTLGQILDIADRVTYVMKDLYNVAGIPNGSLDANPYLLDMRYILSHNQNIGDIHKTIAVEGKTGKVVFTDPQMAYAFLHLRALLWKGLYLHPNSQGRDLLVSNMIRPLYQRGDLDAALLRRMTDNELEDVLYKEYSDFFKSRHSLDWDIRNWFPEWKKFESADEAEQEAEKLTADNATVLAVKQLDGFDAGLDYNVLIDGKIVKFGEDHPQAHLVKEEVRQVKGVYVYYINSGADKPLDQLARKVFLKP